MMHIKIKNRVLIAEDNRVMGNVLKFNLQRAGFEVTLVHDGRAAIQCLATELFDVVVTDYQMPYASGDDICRYIRFDSAQKSIPVILVSAKSIELSSDELIGPERFSEVVYKPFSPKEIVRITHEMIESATKASLRDVC